MRRSATFLALLGLLLLASTVLAQSGDGYDLGWWTVDGGGGDSSGGGYALAGAIAQPDAGLLEGGTYALQGGFWSGGGVVRYDIYLPLLLRDG